MLKIIKKHKYIFTFILILIISFLIIIRKFNLKENNKKYNIYQTESSLVSNIEIEKESINECINKEEITNIKVDIKGQVINPGVYELTSNSRVMDVIKLAGGLTDIANTSLINLSKKLEDEMVIIIYSNNEVLNSNAKEIETVFKIVEKECICPNIKNDSCINTEIDNNTNKENSNNEINNQKENTLVNINTASLEQLMTITGIGESKAISIIEYREKNKFTKVEDIKNVSGIGDALFEKIKDNITI